MQISYAGLQIQDTILISAYCIHSMIKHDTVGEKIDAPKMDICRFYTFLQNSSIFKISKLYTRSDLHNVFLCF